jgi:hypothetical protein
LESAGRETCSFAEAEAVGGGIDDETGSAGFVTALDDLKARQSKE